jgi:hypothetical protein
MGWYAGPKNPNVCSHAKFNLKGCNRFAGHDGPHRNIYDTTNEQWGDDAGMYCETEEQWTALVDNLGKSQQKD